MCIGASVFAGAITEAVGRRPVRAARHAAWAWLDCGGSAAGETFDMNLTSWSGTGLGEDGFSRMLRSSLCVVWVREGGVGVPAGGERGEAARW